MCKESNTNPGTTQWMKVVAIVKASFCNETLANKSTWHMVVLIPKGYGRDFRGIGLVEVLWKTLTGLLNFHFTSEIQFRDILRGFWSIRGMGTSSLKSKLLHQLTAMR